MSVSVQRHVLITHRVATGTDAIKENRTAAVLAETVLMGVTIFRKTFAPVTKSLHMSAPPARIAVRAVFKRWSMMRSWHRKPTKHSAPNPAKASRFRKRNWPTWIPLFLRKSSAVRPFLSSGIHTKGKCLYRIAPSILISTAAFWTRITLTFAESFECLPGRKAGPYYEWTNSAISTAAMKTMNLIWHGIRMP